MNYIGQSHTIAETRCPDCGKRIDSHAGVDHSETPQHGDICLCVGCASVMIYGADGLVRRPTPAELEAALAIPEVMDGIQTLKLFHRSQGQKPQ